MPTSYRGLVVFAAVLLAACSTSLDTRMARPQAPPPESRREVRDVVILGRSRGRMEQVRRLLGSIENTRLHSAFTEADALRTIDAVEDLGVVLLGGATSNAARQRIRAHLDAKHPGVQTSEPGRQYRYSDAGIVADVRRKLGQRASAVGAAR